jgi:hypothetical protein
MTKFKGFFELQTPQDLLQKLRHDFKRLGKSPMDSFAAFDFFVTAHHMPEWLHPGKSNKSKREQLESNSNLLQTVSHLANGAKHFQATHKQHASVKDATVTQGAFDAAAFSPDAFDVGELRVELDGDAAREFGSSIAVLELADKVLHFWEGHV